MTAVGRALLRIQVRDKGKGLWLLRIGQMLSTASPNADTVAHDNLSGDFIIE